MLTPIRAGTSGFRGVTNLEITSMHAFALGNIYTQILKKQEDHEELNIVVGHDQRHGAQMLAHACMAGIEAAGGVVVFLGQTPTGPLSHATRSYGAGGFLITGSHMKPHRIGIIPLDDQGFYCTSVDTDIMEGLLLTFFQEFKQGAVPFDQLGHTVTVQDVDRGYSYFVEVRRRLVKTRGILKNPAIKFHVLLDHGNGTTHSIADELFGMVASHVQHLFEKPLHIPERPSECEPASCGTAIETMIGACGSLDMGLCLDNDGDRSLFIDEHGDWVDPNTIAAIFIRHLLKRGDVVVTPINSSGLIDRVCAEKGIRLEQCKIGQPDTGWATRKYGAAFAFETTNKFAFPLFDWPWYDGMFAGVMMLMVMANTGKSLSELVAEIPASHCFTSSVSLPDDRKYEVAVRAYELAADAFGEDASQSRVDGTKFTFGDRSWLLLRPSGTEPKARIYADSAEEGLAVHLVEQGEGFFRKAIEQVG